MLRESFIYPVSSGDALASPLAVRYGVENTGVGVARLETSRAFETILGTRLGQCSGVLLDGDEDSFAHPNHPEQNWRCPVGQPPGGVRCCGWGNAPIPRPSSRGSREIRLCFSEWSIVHDPQVDPIVDRATL
jgi:hypothetical protein